MKNESTKDEAVKTYSETIKAVELLKNTGCLATEKEEIKLLKCFRTLNTINKCMALSRVEGMVDGQLFSAERK